MIVDNIIDLIGNTPTLKIDKSIHKIDNLNLYAKLELFNPWGSVKDRTALGLIKPHIESLKNGKKVIEFSSSNTAKALQMISLLHNTNTKTITNRIKVSEQKEILQLIGTEIEELPGKSECYDPNDPNDPMVYIENEINNNPGTYIHTDQYKNIDNFKIHFEQTGKELLEEMDNVDYVFGGLGTNGSVKGISSALREKNPDLKSIGVVSENNDFIPGIRSYDEVLEVGLFDPEYYTEILTTSSEKAIAYSLALIRKQGLLAGPTTGASLAGIVEYFEKNPLKKEVNVVFIACDRAEFYLSYYKERRPDIFGNEEKSSWKDTVEIKSDIEITVDELKNLTKNEQIILVDTRNSLSFKAGHISGSMNIPFDTLDSLLDETMPFCTNQKLVFTCAIGEKSKMIASYLSEKGFESFSLKNGITEWRDLDQPLENDL